MNLLLADPEEAVEYIEQITNTNTIRSGHATCLRFNRTGDFLASGRVDGTLVVWDIETMGVARKMRGHNRSITSLSWSGCGRYLLSACQGWKVILWDLQDGTKYREVRFRAPAYIAELHPHNHNLFVASLFEAQPMLVDVTEPVEVKHAPDPLYRSDQARRDDALAESMPETRRDDDRDHLHSIGSGETFWSTPKTERSERSMYPTSTLNTLDVDTLYLIKEHEFEDQVNRLSWNHVTFTATGEYVAASTYNNHEIYVWERRTGSLTRILDGPKEEQGVIEWHPQRHFLATCGLETGRIYVWSIVPEQKWARLAPDFAQVEENQEYVEREDEFDIYGQEELTKRRLDAEDEDVDVVTPYESGALEQQNAGEGGRQGKFRMPILFDLADSDSEEEFVAVSTGTMRRRSPGADGEILDDMSADKKAPAKRRGAKGRKK
ncbi:Set1 complex component swd1 [Verticillium alfalfae VaMs.102]|uniref:Set1 complex component swd1 n=1 Tax=Verticillium alfalfae (strain VaMs.102 / ATCC MYA-4576 / FGSC 10136) TaxID=526221 RepID=C9SR20_VERA1|nr:Set1 complex component swd1 [Verticillium alfalfae VaMs.102]EEY21295.1 Set1 complex component swd1 [Verticillium alfalfae VaMs.102]